MCRFVAYLGREPIVFEEIIKKPMNSLIEQSKESRESEVKLHGDGFGVGWYNHAIDTQPGVFKSIQPAWNDRNLKHISRVVGSECFIAHVRSSTIGDVNFANCHPFTNNDLLFAHNGTIWGFEHIKRDLVGLLPPLLFADIKGQTDSEYVFALTQSILQKEFNDVNADTMAESLRRAILIVSDLMTKRCPGQVARINAVITNGHEMAVSRYMTPCNELPLTLYYTAGDRLADDDQEAFMLPHAEAPGAVLLASERLTDFAHDWNEVPVNHVVSIDTDHTMFMRDIDG